jgi:hypothetical protein
MTKLHEVLAVESSLEKAANNLTQESVRTFGKENLFSGEVKNLEMFREEDKNQETSECRKLETTVMENLDYLIKPVGDYLDVVFQKDLTNQSANADLVLEDGTVLAEKVPATFLLGLESKLGKMREMYLQIPTLEPGIDWVKDELEREGVYKAQNDIVTFRTKKDIEFKVAYEATKEHPAQVVPVDVTVNVGKFTTKKFSGKMSPLDKAHIITRIDALLKATKRARMRANEQKVDTNAKLGAKLLNYINKGK